MRTANPALRRFEGQTDGLVFGFPRGDGKYQGDQDEIDDHGRSPPTKEGRSYAGERNCAGDAAHDDDGFQRQKQAGSEREEKPILGRRTARDAEAAEY